MNVQTKRPIASGKTVPCGLCEGSGLEIRDRYVRGRRVVILTSWACSRCKGRKKVLATQVWFEGMQVWEPALLEVAS
jgi:hypothetical protein